MIDKLTPKFLDKSSDYKLVRKTSFIDALNVYVDVETGGEDTGGVIKPIKGNSGLPTSSYDDTFIEGAEYKAIGSVTDDSTGIVYFFMWCDDPKGHSIWAYDHRGVLPVYDESTESFLPGEKQKVRHIISSEDLNFPVNGFVKGDIVYSNSREFENYDALADSPYPQKDSILYFTDNRNEPRKINVYRALLSGYPSDGTQSIRDFICACPRVPLDRPTFRFVADPDRDVNNFATAPGFQFAYQNVYKDGMESAISPYSSIAFPPSIVDRGAVASDQLLAHNRCIITIPAQNEEVEFVKILARYGNGANFIEIDEVESVEGEAIVFDFYNDRIAGGVSPQTVDKTFDNVPQRAQAQSVASNRLVYGNYVENYDNVDCSGVNLSPVYLDRPAEILDYYLEISPSIEICSGGSEDDASGNQKTPNKTLGFTYETSQFSDSIPANTRVAVSFAFSPDNNFHFYNVGDITHSSYHQSKQVGKNSLNLPGYKSSELNPGEAAVNPDSPASFQENGGFGEPAYLNDAAAGGFFLHENQENFFGHTKGLSKNDGVGQVVWKQDIATSLLGLNVSGERQIAFGTSAGNPLIIVGGKLTFGVEFTVVDAISSGGASFIGDVVGWLLEGRDQAYLDSQVGPGAVTFDPETIKRTHRHEFNLGLQEYTQIPISGENSLKSLMSAAAVVPSGGSLDHSTLESTLKNKPPSCAFIVNKGEAGFYLQKSTEREDGMHRAFSIGCGYITVDSEDDVWTCVRDVDPASPWWAISKSKMTGDIATDSLAEWQQNLQVPGRIFRQMAGTGATDWTRNFCHSFEGDEQKDGMEVCFGHLQINPDAEGRLNLLPFYHDIDTPTGDIAEPIMPISMQDGEGGPGGEGAGDGAAYTVLECHKLGSIAGQVFVGADEDAVEKIPNRGHQFFVESDLSGATGLYSTGESGDRFPFVVNQSIAEDLSLELFDNPNAIDGLYAHQSIFMGPFYTGRIVLNNLQVTNNIGNVNATPLPFAATDGAYLPLTTTLPLVMFSSWDRFPRPADNNNEGSESLGPLIIAEENLYDSSPVEHHATYDNNQVSYANPITQAGGGFEDGELASGNLAPNPFGTGYNSVDFENLQSHMEINSSVTTYEVAGEKPSSFKTSATHELGMVYYDERGRHGRVNPIGSVYVSGYGERNSQPKGRAVIRASNITHRPPSWAKKYKFVYTKNTSVDSFIQYSAGGAFVADSDYEGGTPTSIYVSLNYLQGHPISYSDAFGARGEDNTPVLYSFTPGDRLRVISYMTSLQDADISSVYPVGVEFEVTGLVNLTDETSSHPFPLVEDGNASVPENRQGLFVVLKNNNDAAGFRYQAVNSQSDNWSNNCIFEIVSPVKEVDREDRLYYEIGEAYDVVYATAPEGHPDAGDLQLYHDFETVILDEGDVFFRRHAVNLREYNAQEGFVDMIGLVDDESDDVQSESNFKSFFLESEAATDLFPSRAISIGRPNIIDLDARQTFREASVIHSDRDIVESRKLGYSSFNRTIPSDMEIDTKSGPINYLTNHQDSLFFVQKTKCGHIPVDRTLISDVSGTSSLIASSKFLGTPRYYVGDSGCDNNPESVVSINNAAYFANKSSGKVFKVSGANGVNIISDKGVSEYIRSQFNSAAASAPNGLRVVGGYDPIKKEYLLSIIKNQFSSGPGIGGLVVEDEWDSKSQDITSDGRIFVVGSSGQVYESEFEGPSPDDFDLTEIIPRINVDWNHATNLDSATWQLFYNSVVDEDSGNLNSEFSQWRPSPTNYALPISVDAEIVVTFTNAGLFSDANPPYVDIKVGRDAGEGNFNVGESIKTWNLSELDNLEVTTARTVLGELGLLEVNSGSVWHLSQSTDDPDITIDPDVGGPYSIRVTLNSPNNYAEDDVVTKNVGVRFICASTDDSEDFYNIINPFELANLEDISASFEGAVQITSNNSFRKGTLQETQTSAVIPMQGSLFIPFVEETTAVSLPVDVEDIPSVVFNPCHPVYGIYDLLDENQQVTFDTLMNWFASEKPVLFVEDVFGSFESLTEDQYTAVTNAITDWMTESFGQQLYCPNIASHEPIHDVTS